MWAGAGLATIDPRGWRLAPALGVGLSLLLHGGFLVLALLLVPQRSPEPLPPAPVDVEIVSPSDFAALNPQPVAVAPEPQAASPEADTTSNKTPSPTPPAVAGPTTATRFYARDLLQQPRMARIRRALGTLADSDRLTQLCGIEGIEQIGRALPGFSPEAIVSYAMADPVASGLSLSAAGAAVRSRRKWYRLAFTCSAAADYLAVTAYAFTLGEPIPEAEWDARGLNAEDSDE